MSAFLKCAYMCSNVWNLYQRVHRGIMYVHLGGCFTFSVKILTLNDFIYCRFTLFLKPTDVGDYNSKSRVIDFAEVLLESVLLTLDDVSSTSRSEAHCSLICPACLHVASDPALSFAAASTDVLIGFHLKALFSHRYLLQ